MLRNVEKRGVHAARNGPSPPPSPAGGPVAKAEMSTADRLGSREGSSRAGPPAGEGRKPVAGRVRRACDDAPLSVPVRLCDAPYLLAPGNVVCPQRSPGTCSPTPRPTLLPSAGNWLCFSCSIPHLFVLSHSMPMVNATGKLASFWRFSLTTGSLPSGSLATILPPLATTFYDPPPLATACHRPPNCQEPNGPDLEERILYFSMSPNQSIFTDKIICSSTRRRSPVDRSLVAKAPNVSGFRRACPMDGHKPQCPFSP